MLKARADACAQRGGNNPDNRTTKQLDNKTTRQLESSRVVQESSCPIAKLLWAQLFPDNWTTAQLASC